MFSNLNYKKQKTIVIITFLLIPLLLLLTFSFYPAAELVHLSFTSWDGYSQEKPSVGFANYKELFSNPDVYGVMWHNVAYLLGGIVQNIIALYFAVILNGKIRGRNVFRVVLFSPYILNSVAVGFMFYYMLDTNFGALNVFLRAVDLDNWAISWLGTKEIVNYVLASIGLWKWMGFNMMIYLGAMQSISAGMYEAAKIDGAGSFQTFRYITLPNLRRIIELNMFLTVTGCLEAFDLPFILTKGGPLESSYTFVYKTVDVAFKFNNYGLASAMAVTLLIVVIAVVYVQRKVLVRRES